MIQIGFTIPSGNCPICIAVLKGDTITITVTQMSSDKTEQTVYRLPTEDLRYIKTNRRSKPHSPLGVYHKDTTAFYQPRTNTLTVTTKGNQSPLEFPYSALDEIINMV